MSTEAIFQPMLTMLLISAVVWTWLYAKRIPAMRRARLVTQTYTTPDKVIEHIPEQVNYPAYNFKNLFELPVLFYVLCIYLYVTQNVDAINVGAAWAFVAFRAAHSVVHCTVNVVMARFLLYLGAAIALWFMLGRALINAV